MSDSDRQFISNMAANPTNSKEANMRLMEIADKALGREEDASKIHRQMSNSGNFSRRSFDNAIADLDKKRAATVPGFPTGVTSINVIGQ